VEQEVVVSYDGQVVSLHAHGTQSNIIWVYIGIVIAVIGLSIAVIIYAIRRNRDKEEVFV
jgi:glucose uptake protein GlcU